MATEDTDKQQENTKRVVGRPFPKGVSGNPLGRPKGQTLKEYVRAWLANMTEEEKSEFLKSVPRELVWKMAEGNPANETDVTTGGERLYIPLLGGDTKKSLEELNELYPDNSDPEVAETETED